MYMIGVPLSAAYNRWPRFANQSKWAGVPIMAISLIAASFANEIRYLILTQGVLYAIGGAAVYCPALIFLDEWFIRRKGFAYGVMWVSIPQPFPPSLLNLEILGRYWGRRVGNSVCHELPPGAIWVPNNPSDLGCNSSSNVFAARIFPSTSSTNSIGIAITSPRSRFPSDFDLLASPDGSSH